MGARLRFRTVRSEELADIVGDFESGLGIDRSIEFTRPPDPNLIGAHREALAI